MPELPDVLLYLQALERQFAGKQIVGVEVRSPFLLRSFDIEPESIVGQQIVSFERIGKRILWHLNQDTVLVFHLMIAGRFHWRAKRTSARRKVDLAGFHFEDGTLLLTEASSKKRASLHIVRSNELTDFDRGGLDVLRATPPEFATAVTKENRTLKRALTDPRLLDGIGNAYSDEILHRAQLSPFTRTGQLTAAQLTSLHSACCDTLLEWSNRLQQQNADSFPEKVTAFRDEMAVHGKYGKPCPVCATPVQRVVYAENEMNYCPGCQTDGKILKDRSLSRLLRDDWPKTIDELEA